MKHYLILYFLLLTFTVNGQVVFFESFDEVAGSTTGIDNSGAGATWTALCPGSIAISDYFKVVGGKLEAQDTNEPAATWTTSTFDISACTGLFISFDLIAIDNMEDCVDCGLGGTGSTCIDWVKLEYNLDGAGWTEIAGTSCPPTMTSAPGEMIQIGDIPGGSIFYGSPCIDFGSTLQIRISCMNWAANEKWQFDNITVECNDCVLPVEMGEFNVTLENNLSQLNWTTISERNNAYFSIERSHDGANFIAIGNVEGSGNSTQTQYYHYTDNTPLQFGNVYYRLRQVDFDGKTHLSNTIAVSTTQPIIQISGNQLHITLDEPISTTHLMNIYSLTGQLIFQKTINASTHFYWDKAGVYILEIPSLSVRERFSTF